MCGWRYKMREVVSTLELRRDCSRPFIRRRMTLWEWDYPSVAPLSSVIMAIYEYVSGTAACLIQKPGTHIEPTRFGAARVRQAQRVAAMQERHPDPAARCGVPAVRR